MQRHTELAFYQSLLLYNGGFVFGKVGKEIFGYLRQIILKLNKLDEFEMFILLARVCDEKKAFAKIKHLFANYLIEKLRGSQISVLLEKNHVNLDNLMEDKTALLPYVAYFDDGRLLAQILTQKQITVQKASTKNESFYDITTSLRNNEDALLTDIYKRTILHYAALGRNWQALDLFSRSGLLFNIPDDFGIDPMTIALLNNDEASVESLLKSNTPIHSDTLERYYDVVDIIGGTMFQKLIVPYKNTDPFMTFQLAFRKNNDHLAQIVLSRYRSATSSWIHDALKWASLEGYVDAVVMILATNRVGADVEDNYPIREAAKHGYEVLVDFLLKQKSVDPSACNDEAIRSASEAGHAKVVELLLVDNDPSKSETRRQMTLGLSYRNIVTKSTSTLLNSETSLSSSSSSGGDDDDSDTIVLDLGGESLECLKVNKYDLVFGHSRANPASQHNSAIQLASSNGHIEVVKLLLLDERVDPSANNNAAFQAAYKNGFQEIAKLLYSDPRVWSTVDKTIKVVSA